MDYYCNECKKIISVEEFRYSMNRCHKALCRDHQRSHVISGTTKDLQNLVKERHKDELRKETPDLKTVKDWIHADFTTWDKVLKKEEDASDRNYVSEKERQNRYSKRIKK